ncbi:unnamed protein product [Meloidogyne enterolobii]|uniref:Uncharacterized protein n=1 Tax=Meloidogyne enterolobii TaxID=390850 RepID=A0ACB0XLF4_MELEN
MRKSISFPLFTSILLNFKFFKNFFKGLSASFFQFSPIVEHFLQSFTRNQGLPVLDPKTPNASETPDLTKASYLKIKLF